MSIVTVKKDRYTVDPPLYQWDLNQVLTITGLSLAVIPEIHFTNDAMDRAIVRHASMDNAGVITVDVPNTLLQKPYKIKAYVCIYEDGDAFKSLYKIEIPVIKRNQPNDYVFEDTAGEIYSFNALENLVANALKEIEGVYEKSCKYTDDKVDPYIKEIENARVGVNGKTYDSAGQAIREQFKNIQGSGEVIIVDTELLPTSVNPVQNKVVTAKFTSVDTSIKNLETAVANLQALVVDGNEVSY